MKRKNNDIYYSFDSANKPAGSWADEDLFEIWTNKTALKTSKWWKDLELSKYGIRNMAVRLLESYKEQLGNPNPSESPTAGLTIKACPPVKELLSRSLVITAPCDIHFASMTSDDMPKHVPQQNSKPHQKVTYWAIEWADPRFSNSNIGGHVPEQYTSDNTKTFKNMSNVKITTNLVLSLPDGWSSCFMSPFFDRPDAPFVQIPGVHTGGLAKSINVIWNVMIPDTVKSFEIKAGDPMLYVLFSDRPRHFIPHPKPLQAQVLKRKMFSAATSVEAITDTLKREKNNE
jgi:hypothetical protein